MVRFPCHPPGGVTSPFPPRTQRTEFPERARSTTRKLYLTKYWCWWTWCESWKRASRARHDKRPLDISALINHSKEKENNNHNNKKGPRRRRRRRRRRPGIPGVPAPSSFATRMKGGRDFFFYLVHFLYCSRKLTRIRSLMRRWWFNFNQSTLNGLFIYLYTFPGRSIESALTTIAVSSLFFFDPSNVLRSWRWYLTIRWSVRSESFLILQMFL